METWGPWQSSDLNRISGQTWATPIFFPASLSTRLQSLLQGTDAECLHSVRSIRLLLRFWSSPFFPRWVGRLAVVSWRRLSALQLAIHPLVYVFRRFRKWNLIFVPHSSSSWTLMKPDDPLKWEGLPANLWDCWRSTGYPFAILFLYSKWISLNCTSWSCAWSVSWWGYL